MVRGFIWTGVVLLLAGGQLTGCSLRHPTLMPEDDLAVAEADSVGLAEFLALPAGNQAARRARVDEALKPLVATEAGQDNLDLWLTNPDAWTPYRTYRVMPALGDVIEHLDVALGLDPTRGDLWLARARILDVVGDERRARQSYVMGWEVVTRARDAQDDPVRLKRDLAVGAAWIERDAGWFDEGLAWLDRLRNIDLDDDSEYQLLRGLLLAGRGDLEEAMRVSYGIPPVELPVVSQLGLEGFRGRKTEPTDLLKRWLQAEVWFRRGHPDLAWHALGEIPTWRRVVPLAHRLWQDLGLYAEIDGDGRSNLMYALSYLRRPYRKSLIPTPLSSDQVILGLPKRTANFYRLPSGGYHGGSIFAYAASSTMLALTRGMGMGADRRYFQAQEALNVCIRRGIYPEEALALRGRLRFSRGYYVLAEVDLAAARAAFAEHDEVEPWTSYLLGLVAVGRERPEEAIALLEEAVHADRDLAGAWNALGVARLQLGDTDLARLAFDRAVELDPHDHMAWFNRGLLRAQIGDLAGGLDDFERAARLDPQNERLMRVIQLANVAQRQGRVFLPGLDDAGMWTPAPVDVHAHEDGAFAPRSPLGSEVWYKHLQQVLDEGLDEAGLVARAEGFDAAQLAQIQREYEEHPTPQRRKVLAFGFAWHDLPEEAQRVLAPHWGRDLDRDEMLLLLWLDQRTGEERRLAELAARMSEETRLEFDGFQWAIMALSMLGEDFRRSGDMQTTFDRFDVQNRSTSMGGQYGWYINRRNALIHDGAGTGQYGQGILMHARGRTYHLTGAARGINNPPR
jgi:tetratricopeptide (TPR) repeat protein